MPVDFVKDTGIPRTLGSTAPPPKLKPTGYSGRGATDLVVNQNNQNTFQPQLLGAGGGRVMSGNNNLKPVPQEPSAQPKNNYTPVEGLQLVLDHRAPRPYSPPIQASPSQQLGSAVTMLPNALLSQGASRGTSLNSGITNTITAPFKSLAQGAQSAISGAGSAAGQAAVNSDIGKAVMQGVSNVAQPPLYTKKSFAKLNFLKTMHKVYTTKAASKLLEVVNRASKV